MNYSCQATKGKNDQTVPGLSGTFCFTNEASLFYLQGYGNYINTVKTYFSDVHATLGGSSVSDVLNYQGLYVALQYAFFYNCFCCRLQTCTLGQNVKIENVLYWYLKIVFRLELTTATSLRRCRQWRILTFRGLGGGGRF